MVRNRDENDAVGGPAKELHDVFESHVMSTLTNLKANGHGHPAELIYVSTMAIVGVLNTTAKMLTMPEDESEVDDWVSNPTPRSALLLACLIAARCAVPVKGGINFDFGPRHIMAAIKAAEAILGRSVDGDFSKSMVRAAHMHPEPTHFFDNSNTMADVVNLNTLH